MQRWRTSAGTDRLFLHGLLAFARYRVSMRFPALIVAALMVAQPANAASPTSACRVERLSSAKAACLALVYEQRFLQMEQSIQDLLSRLQAATVPELRALQKQYDGAQTRWYRQVRAACRSRHDEDPVAVETCRLNALKLREERLALSLERAAEDFGAPVEYEVPIPDAIEILIPLPIEIPFGGEARLPLLVPIHPE